MEDMFQRWDRARRSSVGQTCKAVIKDPKCSYHLTNGPVVTSDTIQSIGEAELRKPGTDAVIITWDDRARCPGSCPTTGERRFIDIHPPLVALFPGSHFLPGCP